MLWRTFGCSPSTASISPTLDAEATDLDLMVEAPDELDTPVFQAPHEVAGPVEPRALGLR